MQSLSDEFDPLAHLLAADVHDLSATTFETLAQTLPNQVLDRVHQHKVSTFAAGVEQ